MIDFNADLGEGCPHDAELMDYVHSVNIACAAHAGTPQSMMQALQHAATRQLRIGAHPGYFDREGFGRREQPISPDDLITVVNYQLAALTALAKDARASISYVKPHGAMYHQCCSNTALAQALVAMANRYSLAVMGLPHCELEQVCHSVHVPYIREGFADRRYQSDGNLIPRTAPNAMLRDPTEAARQIYWLIEDVGVDSICVHGDSADAVDFLRRVQVELARSSP